MPIILYEAMSNVNSRLVVVLLSVTRCSWFRSVRLLDHLPDQAWGQRLVRTTRLGGGGLVKRFMQQQHRLCGRVGGCVL